MKSKTKSDAVTSMDADATKPPVIASLVASFAAAEPPVKKVKREAPPDIPRSSPMDNIHMPERVSSGEVKDVSPPPPRRRRTAAVVAELCTTETLQPSKTVRRRQRNRHTEEEFQTMWICGECNEAECQIREDADQLLVCGGPCRRLFHYPCAGLLKPPAEDDDYICQDCQRARHVCAFCHSYGVDEQDVFPCTAAKCGLFFHEACLEIADIPVKLSETAKSSERRREFICPSHACWTCCQEDVTAKEKQLATASRKSARGRKKMSKPSASSFGKKKGLIMVSWSTDLW